MAFINDPQIEKTFMCQVEFYYDSLKFKENNLSQCLQNLKNKKLDVTTIFIFATSSITAGSSQSYNYELSKKRAYVIQKELSKVFPNTKFITENGNSPQRNAHKATIYFSSNSSSNLPASNTPTFSNINPAEESSSKATNINYKYNLGVVTGIYLPFDENTLERSIGLKFKIDFPTEILQNAGIVTTSQSDFYSDSSKDFWRTYLFYGAGKEFKIVKVSMNLLAGIELSDTNSTLSTKFETGLNTTTNFQLDEKFSLGMYYTITNLGQEMGVSLSREL